tara:strand:- start:244 stop:486 length:243 start_codon:yes stop_codon:yes gene_type:complete
MYIQIDIKVGGNTYRISKLEQWLGYWEFYKVTDTSRNLCEYMGSSTSPDFAGELSKIIGEYSGAGSGELFTLVEPEGVKS